jgi:hypothetical protein
MNIFENLQGQILQLRDPEGLVLWAGLPAERRLVATLAQDGVILTLTLSDGTPLFKFRPPAVGHAGDTFSFGDARRPAS